MELTFEDLPNQTFTITYDTEGRQLVIVGIDGTGAETVQASIFVGVLDSEPSE